MSRHSDVTSRHIDATSWHSDVTSRHIDVTSRHSDVTSRHSDVTSRHSDVTHSDMTSAHSRVSAMSGAHSDVIGTHSDVIGAHTDVMDEHDDVTGTSQLDYQTGSLEDSLRGSSSSSPEASSQVYEYQSNNVNSTGSDLLPQGGRFKPKPLKDKTCLVCGDKALGYNFNAVSCESCKAFFRRNAFKEIRGRCEGKCDVTVESRSYCKKCRLRKCGEVGMKRDLILNDQQRQVRRLKIHENRLRRHGLPLPPTSEYLATLGPEGGDKPSPGGKSASSSSSAASLTTSPSGGATITAGDGGGGGSGGGGASTSTSTSSAPYAAESVAEVVKKEPGTLTHVFAAEVDPGSLEGMSEDARKKVEEVLKAFQISFDGPMERNPTATPTGTDFLNMADTSVRRLVKMAKHLETFRKLNQEDQISLLKGSVVEVLILRSAKMFDASTMGWFVNKGGAQHVVSAAALQFDNSDSTSFFQQYQRFACSVVASTKKDPIVLMLMIVLTVLSPDRARDISVETITHAQEEYAQVLREYVGARYPDDELMFARVLQKLADIRDLNETHTKMLMHMNVEQLEPLIVEIFDISA